MLQFLDTIFPTDQNLGEGWGISPCHDATDSNADFCNKYFQLPLWSHSPFNVFRKKKPSCRYGGPTVRRCRKASKWFCHV